MRRCDRGALGLIYRAFNEAPRQHVAVSTDVALAARALRWTTEVQAPAMLLLDALRAGDSADEISDLTRSLADAVRRAAALRGEA